MKGMMAAEGVQGQDAVKIFGHKGEGRKGN